MNIDYKGHDDSLTTSKKMIYDGHCEAQVRSYSNERQFKPFFSLLCGNNSYFGYFY
jgi:hypothetical protein